MSKDSQEYIKVSDISELHNCDDTSLPTQSNSGYNSEPMCSNPMASSSSLHSPTSPGENIQKQQLDYKIRLNNSVPRQFASRKSTVILTNTGERVKRNLSLSLPQDQCYEQEGVRGGGLLLTPSSNTSYNNGENRNDINDDNFVNNNNNNNNNNNGSTKFRQLCTIIKNFYYDSTNQSVAKCAIAYFIASLGVFYTPFDDLLGSTDSKHVIATVAVYFHPTRTKGSMNQTMIFVVISLLYSFIVSFGCRYISSIFYTHGKDDISHIIDLIVSSVALGIISFMKQKVNKQTFNTACSVACITIVACIIKEGSKNAGEVPIDRFEGTFNVVVCGSMISFLCCYLIWPVSATKLLQETLSHSYLNYSLVLLTLTRRFVAGEQLTKKDMALVDSLRKNVTQLQQYLEEAKFELRLWGQEEEWNYYQGLVATTISLARHLQALSSATTMQWNLLNESDADNASSTSTMRSYTTDDFGNSLTSLNRLVSNCPTPATHHHQYHNRKGIDEEVDQDQDQDQREGAAPSLQLFDLFIYHLAPSIRSLVYTIRDVMVNAPFNQSDTKSLDPETLRTALVKALEMYETRQDTAFEHIYSEKLFEHNTSHHYQTDQEEVAACCGNFATLLSQLATELLKSVDCFEKYEKSSRKRTRSWPWLRWKQYKLKKDYIQDTSLHAALDDLREQYGLPLTQPQFHSAWEKFSYKIWSAAKNFRRTDIQFGIRVGLGAAGISMFAFIPETRQFFENWRLEWALTVYCIMMNKSLGGTTMTVKWRILGTFLGAFAAFIIWHLFDANAYILAPAGFLIALPSFYIILFWKLNNAFGRFILLTYNLTMLYSYSMLQKDSEDDKEGGEEPIVGEIAFHRFAAVSIGIIWALTMATCFLPNSARARLKNGLSVLWLRLGVIWNSDPLEYDPSSMTLVGFKAEEGTNDILSECETLLKQAPVEFRLKGTFPTKTYSKLIKDSSAIIDAFQNLDLLIKVDPTLTTNEEYVLKYIEVERNEVEQRIFLVFYMIASAMKLGFSLPKKFASIDHAKDRMLFKLSEIRQQQQDNGRGFHLKNTDFILLYSYILVASNVSALLDDILVEIKGLLGEISEDKFRLV